MLLSTQTSTKNEKKKGWKYLGAQQDRQKGSSIQEWRMLQIGNDGERKTYMKKKDSHCR